MRFEKLSKQERADWERLTECEYADSPLVDKVSEGAFGFLCGVLDYCLEDEFEWMLHLIASAGSSYVECCNDPEAGALIMRAYEHGVASGDGGCCCNLANMYHSTDVGGSVEDYETARELYELGMERGDDQAAVNLGYLYYYGRGVQIDYGKAYQCYAHAAIMTGNPEALWKLGDLYAGGKGVAKSDRTAWDLYNKAYEHAEDSAFTCRAAHHMADYLMTGVEGVVEPDPLRALKLYFEAEIGYRKAIDAGLVYYRGQLRKAIEGEQRASAALSNLS